MDHYVGRLDPVRGQKISGWVLNKTSPEKIISIELHVDGNCTKVTTPHVLRKKILEKGLHPTGICGFTFEISDVDITNNPEITLIISGTNQHIGDPVRIQESTEKSSEAESVLIVGLNKSGTSILTYVVAGGLQNATIHFEPGNFNSLSDLDLHKEITKQSPVVTKSLYYPRHKINDINRIGHLYDKCIWIIRDPRDVIISAFFYTWYHGHKQQQGKFEQALSETIRKENAPDKIPFHHLTSIIYDAKSTIPHFYGSLVNAIKDLDNNWLVIKYEDIINKEYKRLEDYLGFKIDRNAKVSKTLKRVERSKKSENWRNWFNLDDVKYYSPLLIPTLDSLGYDISDWNINQPSRLNPSEGSEYMRSIANNPKTDSPTDSASKDVFPPPGILNYKNRKGYLETGDNYLRLFIEYGLKPNHHVLEIGCGTGRISRVMRDFLSRGSFIGVDIMTEAIDWCKKSFQDVPHMKFESLPVNNDYYNVFNTTDPAKFAFKYKDSQFDFIYLTSVFTHLLKPGLENYIKECARMIKKGGTFLATFFLLDEYTFELMKEGKASRIFHKSEIKNMHLFNPDKPQAAVAYDKRFLQDLLFTNGLKITNMIDGKWRDRASKGNKHKTFNQDVVIASKQ